MSESYEPDDVGRILLKDFYDAAPNERVPSSAFAPAPCIICGAPYASCADYTVRVNNTTEKK